jgi:hypothetical protein
MKESGIVLGRRLLKAQVFRAVTSGPFQQAVEIFGR